MNSKISSATKSNFKRLKKDLNNHAFTQRANKQDSKKTIVPFEYYTNIENTGVISHIVDAVRGNDIDVIISSLIIVYFKQYNLIQILNKRIETDYKYIKEFIDTLDYSEELLNFELPLDERDPLGIIYQQLKTEGEKNKKGSYYTPKAIVDELLNVLIDENSSFCDPCCGTGGFLIEAQKRFNPRNVYGYDIDVIAVKIAKTNMFINNPNINYNKQILNKNFLLVEDREYDYIISNPPWGNIESPDVIPLITQIKSKEMSSYFMEHSIKLLSNNGIINFLLPISILNVKTHFDIRKMMTSDNKIEEVRIFGKCFKGVLTDVISIKIKKEITDQNYEYTITDESGKKYKCPISTVKNNRNLNISLLDELDNRIVNKIENNAKTNLMDAEFALGIVTGDNKNKIKREQSDKLRPLIVGKDIKKYNLKKPSNYIEYKREEFQQVCKDKFFSVEIKLLYRFISKKLIFAIDTNRYLALNSANIMLLPKNYCLDEYNVLAILNSDVMNYYFIKMVNQIKILKNDIQNLPIPLFPVELQAELTELVKKAIKDNDNKTNASIEARIYDYYNFTEEEKQRIKQIVYGRYE